MSYSGTNNPGSEHPVSVDFGKICEIRKSKYPLISIPAGRLATVKFWKTVIFLLGPKSGKFSYRDARGYAPWRGWKTRRLWHPGRILLFSAKNSQQYPGYLWKKEFDWRVFLMGG
jgi:hypothetical protein